MYIYNIHIVEVVIRKMGYLIHNSTVKLLCVAIGEYFIVITSEKILLFRIMYIQPNISWFLQD